MEIGWAAKEFFRRIHHVADRNGQFENNVPVIKDRIYAGDRRVSYRQVEAWLRECESTGLLELREQNGLQLGKIVTWDQKLQHTKALHPLEGTEAGPEPLPNIARDPPESLNKKKRNEEMCVNNAHSAPSHTQVSREDWLDGLAKTYPGINIPAEYRNARNYVRAKRDPAGRVGRLFFEKQWLPKCEPEDESSPGKLSGGKSVSSIPEPNGWREYAKEEKLGPEANYHKEEWQNLGSEPQKWIIEGMRASGHGS